MAWKCTGKTNAELIGNMLKNGIISSTRVGEAMAKVDRANYVLLGDKASAYVDAPQPIGHKATISAPHMHAYAAENLLPFLKPGARVLDVGSGSGYLTGIFYHLVTEGAADGRIVGIEHIPELVALSQDNLRRDGLGHALESNHIRLVNADGRQGYANAGPYAVIHVGAAAPTLPQPLIDQLASPGRMFIPIGTHSQSVIQVDKDEKGDVTEKEIMGVMYVPLTDKPGAMI